MATALETRRGNLASPISMNGMTAFAEAQKAGRPILVAIHASWWPDLQGADTNLGPTDG